MDLPRHLMENDVIEFPITLDGIILGQVVLMLRMPSAGEPDHLRTGVHADTFNGTELGQQCAILAAQQQDRLALGDDETEVFRDLVMVKPVPISPAIEIPSDLAPD
jgi:hypothetical protein